MKKIYIAGCGGMLGEAFYKKFSNEYDLMCTDIDVNESWLSYLDFRNLKEYKSQVEKFNPDYLIHLGAHTSLEYCEMNSYDAYDTNTKSVENAVYISNILNIPIIYISTAGIFDGSKEEFDDWDTPNPLGVYARTKYLGERFVIENSSRYLVCRAGWMMGGGPKKDKKFINKIIKQINAGNKEIFIVDDKDGTPTYTHDFALNTKKLLELEYWGLYNMVCDGLTSRVEAKEILKILGQSENINLKKVRSSFFEKEYFAIRPSSERLINKKLNLRKVNIMRNWKVALHDYINSYYK